MTRSAAAVAATGAMLLLAACSGHPTPPERAPDALGSASAVELTTESTSVAFSPDEGYEYFEGTTFVLDDEVGIAGAVTDASAIETGDRLKVWTHECAESFPVQCRVEHVQVLD